MNTANGSFVERFNAGSSSLDENKENCGAKKSKTAENFVLVKQNSSILSPAQGDRKKKCFSVQGPVVENDHDYASKDVFNLTDLPLLPLSYICSKLPLNDRQSLRKICPKLAIADEIAWLRRTTLNIKSDIAFYVSNEKREISVLDEKFDFVSLSLIISKLQLITANFTGCRLNTIDFSHPSDFFQGKKFGNIFLLNFEYFTLNALFIPDNILELNFRHTFITADDLEVCSLLFPKITAVVLSLATVIWRENHLLEHQMSTTTVTFTSHWAKNYGETKRFFEYCNAKNLISLLYHIFPRLKRITLFNF